MIATQPIRITLRRIRNRLARVTLERDLLQAVLFLGSLYTTAIWYEHQLYLSTTVRGIIAWSLMDLTLLLFLVIILRWLGTWRGWWPWARTEAIAAEVGTKLGTASDRLLNAMQLERRLAAPEPPANADLLTRSVSIMTRRIAELEYEDLTPRRYRLPLWRAGAILGLLLLVWITALNPMAQATMRLFHPEQEYPFPRPFIILSLSGDSQVLTGDTTEVVFTAIGAMPPSIELVWEDNNNRFSTIDLPLDVDRYIFKFEDIRDDVSYYARFVNPNWFSHWDQITSQTHTITLIDRPVIEELIFTITPPEYTGEPASEVGGNVADIASLVGSQIHLAGTTNLPLNSASLYLDTVEVPVSVEGISIEGSFTLLRTTEVTISVKDTRDVANTNPIHYSFTALPDYAPILSMILPQTMMELDESMMMPIRFDVSDDFGFSQAQVFYEIRHPEYLTQDDQTYTSNIPELLPNRRSQQVTHLWDLSSLGLVPGDEVHFHINVYDNNIISGPGRAVSGTFVARFPTLTDLFTRTSERSDEAISIAEDALEDLEDIRILMDEMELAFRGAEDISWEHQQQGKEILESLEEVMTALESVQEQIAELGAQAEQNNLFTDEILQKYNEVQNLLDEIMSPELAEAMSQLREALENIDPERLRTALHNLQFQASEFGAQLDRFLDIFQRALAEMKMDEVVTRLEQMVITEGELLDQLNRTVADQERENREDARAPSTEVSQQLQDLAARHNEQERALDMVREVMGEAAEAMVPYSLQSAQQLNTLRSSDLAQEAEESLDQGTRFLQNQQTGDSQVELMRSEELLRALRDAAADIRDQFQLETVNAMLAQFQRVLSGILAISKQQEELQLETETLSNNSPRIRETAEIQHTLLRGMTLFIEQLIELSRQSFYITPEVGFKIGQASAAMQSAVGSLEGNDPSAAASAQLESMTALNETAVALNNAMIEMENSGSASGYEQFLERMQSLTQGQEGLNDRVLSMQLNQLAMSQIELMQRLQAQQRQLAEVLEQIIDDYPTQSGGEQGGLNQALQDMEEVIRDFQQRRITNQTVERQQRIVTRLLDSQKSLTVQDFKEERRGEVATQDFVYTGPSGLPEDLGEREDIIMQAMERALRTGYSQTYQVIIQNYFQQLAGRSPVTE